MIKIFSFGSCRTTFGKIDKEISATNNYDFAYSTKEALMYLDLYDGIKNVNEYQNINLLMKSPSDFNLEYYKKAYDEADIITIDLSTFKIYKLNNYYYNIINVDKYLTKDIKLNSYTQSVEEIINDLKIIKERIKKPIIFIGPYNLNYYDIECFNGYIENREKLEVILKENTENYVSFKEFFKDYDYKEISFMYHSKDTNHIKPEYKLMFLQEVLKKAKSIIND